MKKPKSILYLSRSFLKLAASCKIYRTSARHIINKARAVTYRIAQAEDMELLGRFLYQDDEEMLAAFILEMRSPRSDVYHIVAQSCNKIIASATLSRNSLDAGSQGDWWLSGVYVVPFWRGCGIGQGLTELAILQARQIGLSQLKLIVDRRNKTAVALYRKLGFADLESAGNALPPRTENLQRAPHDLFLAKDLLEP